MAELNGRPTVACAIEAYAKEGITDVMLVTGGAHVGEFVRLLSNGRRPDLALGRPDAERTARYARPSWPA